ncbi:MAG: hypothetical protein EHM28_13300, partial [Spirochaetaceae bacterium]
MSEPSAVKLAKIKENGIYMFMAALTAMVLLVPVSIFWIISSSSLGLLFEKGFFPVVFGETWKPLSGQFGLLPFLTGSVIVTLLALVLAFPLSLGVSIFITEYASKKIKMLIRPVVDLLAGLPSVLYGIWGMLVIVPFVKDMAFELFGIKSTGLSVLSASVILALMVLPVLVQICCEVLQSVP